MIVWEDEDDKGVEKRRDQPCRKRNARAVLDPLTPT